MSSKPLFLLLAMFLISGTCFSQGKGTTMKENLKSAGIKTKKLLIKYGTASYYAIRFHKQRTASGELHDKGLLTAACNSLPLNSWVKVTNLKNNTSVIVKINDRLHKKNKRLLDLSYAAAEKLSFISSGIANVKMEVLDNFMLE
jgi:rare lipoprotein A